jgi:lipopolysaccharide transport system ATP-binding protein
LNQPFQTSSKVIVMNPVIRFDQVSKRYRLGTVRTSLREAITNGVKHFLIPGIKEENESRMLWALKDVSFELQKGSSLGLIGPNGAGKTTILKILSKITQPTSGKVNVRGRISALIELGAGFHPDLTGRENIYLNGVIMGLSRQEVAKSFDRIVAFSGLERFIDTPVKRYSSGMYVRLGFSVAAHVEPDVLLVDEVLAVGDAEFRQRCATRISELQNLGTTIVFVAHNLYLVKSVCDTVFFINHGEIQEQGNAIKAIKAYETWLHRDRLSKSSPSNGHYPDPTENSTVKITAVEVRTIEGFSTEKFEFDDGVEICVHYSLSRPIINPNLVLRISRADGVTCAMVRTDEHGYKLEELDGEGVISVVINPLQLAGGAYVVEAKLMMGAIDGEPLAAAHSSWFEVNGLSLSHVEASGVFVPSVAAVKKGSTSLHKKMLHNP